jgi:hypothetical protein
MVTVVNVNTAAIRIAQTSTKVALTMRPSARVPRPPGDAMVVAGQPPAIASPSP